MTKDVDIAITGGTIIDGTGAASFRGSIGIAGDRIVQVTEEALHANSIIDASRCVVSPGFIDSHSNLSWGLLLDPTCAIQTYQGVTTAITGNCGGSSFPVEGAAAEWIKKAASDYGVAATWHSLSDYASTLRPIGIDVCPMVGHGMIRAAAAGFVTRPLWTAEEQHLRKLVRESLEAGAWGISFGLAYAPGMFADQDELIACGQEAAGAGRVCCFHMRIESDGLEDSVREVLQFAKKSHARCVVCHHKALGRKNWGKTESTLAMIDEANQDGCDIFLDMYPYTTALRNLGTLLPDWAHEGGRLRFVERLGNPEFTTKLLDGLRENIKRWDAAWEDTLIWSSPNTPDYEDKLASTVIQEEGERTLLDLLYKNDGRVITLYKGANEDDLAAVAKHPRAIVGSDGDAQRVTDKGHPRSFATFPRFLAEFAMRRPILSLEEAVKRMTSLPAQIFGLSDRGTLQVGRRADICVFSLDAANKFADATEHLAAPFPEHLLVGGRFAIIDRQPTGLLNGQVLQARI